MLNRVESEVVDEMFDGSSGRRIYGAKDLARAARIYGIALTQTNADSYAQFANGKFNLLVNA